MESENPSVVRCPTCRAVQEWSETCRRCRCDLSLLRAVAASYEAHRGRCLDGLRAGRFGPALREARICWSLQPGPEARRLVAVCSLLSGDLAGALAAAQTPETGR